MKCFYIIVLMFFLFGCNDDQISPVGKVINHDSIVNEYRGDKAIPPYKTSDSLALVQLSKDILTSLKKRDLQQFASFIHPVEGIRFSPYAYIDTSHDQRLNQKEFVELIPSLQKLDWGFYDGSGDSIKLTIKNYFRRFVYDADFLNAEKISVNRFSSAGNSLNNIIVVYPNCDFTEFYFPGFDTKFNGMDWKSIRLVFKDYNNKPYLIAIVHDQWTT